MTEEMDRLKRNEQTGIYKTTEEDAMIIDEL